MKFRPDTAYNQETLRRNLTNRALLFVPFGITPQMSSNLEIGVCEFALCNLLMIVGNHHGVGGLKRIS
eukprot:1393210-Amorphochlora_amoeboformis.AAC.1